jgi:hypothetical protein
LQQESSTVKEAYLPAVALQSTIVLLDNKYFYWSNNRISFEDVIEIALKALGRTSEAAFVKAKKLRYTS